MITKFYFILGCMAILSLGLYGQDFDDTCYETDFCFYYNRSLEADLIPFDHKASISVADNVTTCEFYEKFANPLVQVGMPDAPFECQVDHVPYSTSLIKDLLGAGLVNIEYTYFAKLQIDNHDYYIICGVMHADGNSQICRQTYAVVRVEKTNNVLVNMSAYRDLYNWNSLFCYTNLAQFGDPLLLNMGYTITKDNNVALSPEKILRDSLQSLVELNKCTVDSERQVFCIATNYVDDRIRILRQYYSDTSVVMNIPRGRKILWHEYEPCKQLIRFMTANEAPALAPLYHNPGHVPIFTYTRLKAAGRDPKFESHYLQKVFTTPLPNSYGLSLTAIRLKTYFDNKFTGYKTLVFIDTPQGKFIFTDFDKYPDLLQQIKFRIAFKPAAVDFLAKRSYREMTTDVEKKLWRAARRKGETQFLLDYLTDFVEENGRPYESYIYDDVDLIEAGEFWY